MQIYRVTPKYGEVNIRAEPRGNAALIGKLTTTSDYSELEVVIGGSYALPDKTTSSSWIRVRAEERDLFMAWAYVTWENLGDVIFIDLPYYTLAAPLPVIDGIIDGLYGLYLAVKSGRDRAMGVPYEEDK